MAYKMITKDNLIFLIGTSAGLSIAGAMIRL
jgi:hypothetical protein